jgi:hypothetical protein
MRALVALPILAALLGGASACDDPATKSESNVSEKTKSTSERIDDLFQSVLDGVQLIESADSVTKLTGEIDTSTQPPHYLVLYEGCLDGFLSGSFCVRDGSHLIEIVAPETHIIRSVDQRYLLDRFASVPDYAMTGTLDSYVEVSVDVAEQMTEVSGLASGTFAVTGALEGDVGVELEIGGGRDYTEGTATPIVITGTMSFAGESYPVEGGFHRE